LQLEKTMDNYYFVPHIGLQQVPSPFKDTEGWEAANEGLGKLAQLCSADKGCSGFDTDLHARDKSTTRTVASHYEDASKGVYYKDQSEFESACTAVKGTVEGNKCAGVSSEDAKTWVNTQNTIMDTLYGPVSVEEFAVGLDHGLRLGLVVAAVMLVLLKLTRLL
jgi:hypothetical protein